MKREELLKLEKLITDYLENKKPIENKSGPIYSSGLNFFISNNSQYKKLIDNKTQIKNAKIMRGAKNLILEFIDLNLNNYLDLKDDLLDNIDNLNNKLYLMPSKELIIECIQNTFKNYELKFDVLYNSFIFDIFNQGKQHQTLNNSAIKIKKFTLFDKIDNDNYQEINNVLKEELFNVIKDIKNITLNIAIESIKMDDSKRNLIDSIAFELNKYTFKFEEISRLGALKTYEFGNFSQLKKDGIIL